MYRKLIKRVMELLLDGDSEVLETLSGQYKCSKITDIKETGKGVFVNFKVIGKTMQLGGDIGGHSNIKQDFVFGDVNGIVEGVAGAVGFILFVRNGYISTLEGYANVPGSWAKVNEDTVLVYMPEQRDLKKLEKNWTK